MMGKERTLGFLGLLGLLTGCVHNVAMKPPQERGAPVPSYAEAKSEIETMPGHAMTGCRIGTSYMQADRVRVTDAGFDVDCTSYETKQKTPVHCDLSALAPTVIDESAMALSDHWRVLTGPQCAFWADFGRRSDADQYWDALYVLKHTALGDLPAPAESDADKAAFEKIVADYRAQSVKPALPENARRYKIQAETAVREKRYDDAVDLYDKGLKIAPRWPEGHYNRALLLGESGRKQDAIAEMKKYLELEPDAPDARAAQDKIYEWGG